MFYNSIKTLLVVSILSLTIISCSEDEQVVSTENLEVPELERGGRGDGGGPDGQNPPNKGSNAIESIDNSVSQNWMNLFLELDRYATGMRPNATARAIAYINLAAFETAIPGMPGFQSNSHSIPGFRIRHELHHSNIKWELAINACYADVMAHFMLNIPGNLSEQINALENNIETTLIADIDQKTINDSKEWGTSVASQVIAFSQTDEEAEAQILEPQPRSYEPPVGDGFWTYSADQERALFPYWESVRTFVITPEQTTSVPPLSYSEDLDNPYYHEMIEVYEVNNRARTEDNEELWIAEFWSDDVETNTFGPPARQISIANQLIDEHNLNLEQSLHLLLKLGFSLNDAAVATWKYKYEYMVMRPNVFIHEFIDPTYQTNLYRLTPWPNPTFPGYPSGHSAFASAAGGVFTDFFGPMANFTDRSHEGRTEFRSAPRSFETFDDMAAENGYSRIPLGVHIRMDCTEGLRLGYEIANAINNYNLRRRRS